LLLSTPNFIYPDLHLVHCSTLRNSPKLVSPSLPDLRNNTHNPAIESFAARMSKIIAVTGATGTQGGGVINIMKKTPGWTVRAVTRNPESDAAKRLAAEGIEVVQANFDDEASLVKAFEVSWSCFWLVLRGSSFQSCVMMS
jgi:hypothetical protein